MTSGDGRTYERMNQRSKIENPGVGRPILGPAKITTQEGKTFYDLLTSMVLGSSGHQCGQCLIYLTVSHSTLK